MKINLTDQELNLPVSKLSDQVLNEWVCLNIMKWVYVSDPLALFESYARKESECNSFKLSMHSIRSGEVFKFSPSKVLDDSYLMEEKIREMGKYKDEWYDWSDVYVKKLNNLVHLVAQNTNAFHFCHASARQRCEAAYLTFNKE